MKAAVAILCVAAVASCIKDKTYHIVPSPDDGVLETVSISVSVPDDVKLRTRGDAFLPEIDIVEVDVLQFRPDGTFARRAVGTNITGNGTGDVEAGTGERDFETKLLAGTYDLVVIANARTRVNDAVNGTNGVTAWDKNTTMQDALDRLKITIDAEDCLFENGDGGECVFNRLPMFGITQNRTVDKNNRNHTVEMVRMVAKVDVKYGSQAVYDIFRLVAVNVYNQPLEGWVAPKISTWPTGNVSTSAYFGGAAAPSKASYTGSPSDSPIRTGGVSSEGITGQIYLFEVPAGSQTGRDTNTCLVVEGRYNPDQSNWTLVEPSYYRVDFRRNTGTAQDPVWEYMPLLRNHHYTVSVTSVTGPGYPTPEDAFYGSARLEAEIVDWSQKPQNVIIDGQYFLAVDKDLVELKGSGRRKEFTAETNYNISDQGFPSGLQVKSAEIVYGPEGSGWLTVDNVNGSLERNIGMTATRNGAGAVRTAKVMLKAGNMTKVIDVTQTPAGVLASPGVIGYTEDTGEITLRGSEEYGVNADIAAAAEQMFPGEGLHEQTVYAAYFKFGSLVAISSDPTDSASPYLEPDDIIASPAEWKGSLEAARNYIGTTWGNIPVSPSLSTGATIGTDLAAGLGDPCAYWFGGDWMLPTGFPYNGIPDYSTSNLVWQDANGSIPAGRMSNRTGETGIFYPAAGYRDRNTGQVSDQGFYGMYWSSTADSDAYGQDMYFDPNGVTSSYSENYAWAFTIRCVKAPAIPDPPGGMTTETTTGGGGRAIGPNTYVGAFWKAGEKGERLIKIPVTTNDAAGKWKVRVYSYGAGGIYPKTNGDSFDSAEGVSTDFKKRDIIFGEYDGTIPASIGNAESNVVTGGEEIGGTVANGGEIAFRIGLKQTWNGPAPRYAVAVITYGFRSDNPAGYHQLLFLRQGDQDDYLMRPTEPAYTGNSMTDRPMARKWSPYNLTAPQFKGAGVSTDGENSNGNAWVDVRPTWGAAPSVAQPTDYPTQAGAYFKWAHTEGVRAWNPSGDPSSATNWDWYAHDYTVSIPWDTTDPESSHGGGTIGDNYESCPEGYRRPTDGGDTDHMDEPGKMDNNKSETFQSLFSNLPAWRNSDAKNSVWGRYADGFFDRQAIVNSLGEMANPTPSAVSVDNSAVAYIGRLFHNPTSHNSLFFPASGYRNNGYGTLGMTGNAGHYWSSSSNADYAGWQLDIGSYPSRHNYPHGYGFSVRCVVDEPASDPDPEPEIDLFWLKSSFTDGDADWNPTPLTDNTDYIFPWNTTNVRFNALANSVVTYLDEGSGHEEGYFVSTSSIVNPPEGMNVNEYIFRFDKDENGPRVASYAASHDYSISFLPGTGIYPNITLLDPVAIDFSRDLQKLDFMINLTSAAHIDYQGYDRAYPGMSAIPMNTNVRWAFVTRDWGQGYTVGNEWMLFKTTDMNSSWVVPYDSDDLTQNDRLTSPMTRLNYEGAAHNVSSMLYMQVDQLDLNEKPGGVDYRQFTADFINLDYDATRGGAPGVTNYQVRQWAPVLRNSANNSSTSQGIFYTDSPIPAGGGSYTVHAETNLPWGVAVFSGPVNGGTLLGVSMYPSNSSVYKDEGPSHLNITNVAIPANTTGAPRQLSVYLFTTEESFYPILTEAPFFNPDYLVKVGERMQEWEEEEPEEPLSGGGENHVLYFDSSDANHPLKIGRWGEVLPSDGDVRVGNGTEPMKAVTDPESMAFFKFGSVVGFTLPGASFRGNQIKFDPSRMYHDSNTSGDWDLIASGYDDSSQNISDPSYNTGSNLRQGKGDPCRLAGFDISILTYTAADEAVLEAYDSGWRMPTAEENRLFIGNKPTEITSRNNNTSGYYISSGSWNSDDPGIGTFLKNPQTPGITLPGMGRRINTYTISTIGSVGYYWSSTLNSSSSSYVLYFNSSSVIPSSTSNNHHTNGLSVRCIKNE